MKKYFLIFFIIFTSFLLSQPTTQNVYVVRGDVKSLTFSYSGDITETDIQFIVKTGTEFSDPRVIQKTYDPDIEGTQITVSYSAPYTFITVNILAEDTEDLSGYSFYYDMTSDVTTIFQGDFKLWYDISTPYDGTLLPGSGVRIASYTLQNGSVTGDLITWDNDLGVWEPTTDLTVKISGAQNIAGIKTTTDQWNTENLVPRTHREYVLGGITNEWLRVYAYSVRARQFITYSVSQTDSGIIRFDEDRGFDFDNRVTFQLPISFDSAASIKSLRIEELEYIPDLATDSIITIDSLQSNLKIFPTDNMTRVIGMYMDGASEGTIVVVMNMSFNHTIVIKDNIYSGLFGENSNNLFQIAGDFTMGYLDNITLKYTYNITDLAFQWVQIARNDN